MRESQSIALKMSEIRQKLNALAEDAPDEERNALTSEYGTLESRYRAALITEDEEDRQTPTPDVDAEEREARMLELRISAGNYIQAVVENRSLDGREAEYQEARGLNNSSVQTLAGAGIQLPWAALLPRTEAELRAGASTVAPADVGVNQMPILARVFAQTAGAYLGVGFPQVGVGEVVYPVLTSGETPDMLEPGAEQTGTIAVFTPNVLGPKRLSARYQFRVEDLARFSMMEEALRQDLRGAMGEAMDFQVINGDATGANVNGFLNELTAAADGNTEWEFSEYAMQRALQVDGRYANVQEDVSILVGQDTYGHAASKYANNRSDLSGLDKMMPRVSAHIPAKAANAGGETVQSAIAFKKSAPGPNAVAPMWPTISLIRDQYTRADHGEISITAIGLWNFKVLREAAYAHLRAVLADNS